MTEKTSQIDKQGDTSTAHPKLCQGERKDGQPCNAWACAGSEHCFMHDPARAEERKAARAKGGRARHGRKVGVVGEPEPVTISGVADVVKLLERTVNDALKLENSIQRVRAIAYVLGVIVKALEVGELEERLAALERALQERRE